MRKLILVLIAAYIGFCATIYFYPQAFFYAPSNEASSIENARANGYNAEIIEYQSQDLTDLFAWYSRPKNSNGKVIVFMHGNSYNVESFYFKLISFQNKGYATFIPEYRGFGGLRGDINQSNLSQDAISSILALNKMGYKNKDIYVYGFSLGTYMATNTVYNLQKNGTFAGLILEAPFDSLLNTAKEKTPIYAPLDYLMQDTYNTAQIISEIKSPLLVMLGTKDETIPYELGKRLFALAKQPKELIIYKGGGHSNLFNFRNDKDILRWLGQ